MNNQFVVPRRGTSYQGALNRKPWDAAATVAIPHIGDPEPLLHCVQLLRAQTIPLHIVVIDTGSSAKHFETVSTLAGYGSVEVHAMRSHGWRHASEPVSVAMDFAVALCRTKWLVCTHADCFVTRRDAVEDLLDIASRGPGLTGYAISPREHWRNPDGHQNVDWMWMVGHTFTALNVPLVQTRAIRWDLAALANAKQWGPHEDWPNIVDTEVGLNYFFRWATRNVPQQIGTEQNYARNITAHFDHVRSAPSAALYMPENSDLRIKQRRWMRSALADAKRRIAEWSALAVL